MVARQPWSSPAVVKLASRLGRDRSVVPMLIEGPRGTVLGAVGNAADHDIASHALGKAQQARLAGKLSRARSDVDLGSSDSTRVAARGLLTARAGGSGVSMMGRGSSTSTSLALAPDPMVFGAVYEHRDVFGKPKFIGSTDAVPEVKFEMDRRQHSGVDELLSRRCGTSAVVWAACGRSPVVGKEEMFLMRTAVESRRAERLKLEKLSGIKPYSRHGY